jgi:hypothetical protein
LQKIPEIFPEIAKNPRDIPRDCEKLAIGIKKLTKILKI